MREIAKIQTCHRFFLNNRSEKGESVFVRRQEIAFFTGRINGFDYGLFWRTDKSCRNGTSAKHKAIAQPQRIHIYILTTAPSQRRYGFQQQPHVGCAVNVYRPVVISGIVRGGKRFASCGKGGCFPWRHRHAGVVYGNQIDETCLFGSYACGRRKHGIIVFDAWKDKILFDAACRFRKIYINFLGR